MEGEEKEGRRAAEGGRGTERRKAREKRLLLVVQHTVIVCSIDYCMLLTSLKPRRGEANCSPTDYQ